MLPAPHNSSRLWTSSETLRSLPHCVGKLFDNQDYYYHYHGCTEWVNDLPYKGNDDDDDDDDDDNGDDDDDYDDDDDDNYNDIMAKVSPVWLLMPTQ